MNEPILQLYDLTAGYHRPRRETVRVVTHVHETLHAGELVCLIGPNGAGKSTLLRTIAGMQPAIAGKVMLMGQDIHQMRADERARRLSIVLTQKMDGGLLTGYALVAMGRHPYTGWMGKLSADDHAIVHWAIAQVGAQQLSERHFNTLSDGERQKLMIARALAQEPELMILDEPTAFLDLPRRVECMVLLRDLTQRTGRTILLSTHDLDLALRCADRIWLLPYGGHLQVGMPEDLVLNGAFQMAFNSAGARFDITTGTFTAARRTTRQVVLEGQGVVHYWTQRALEREGFLVEAMPQAGLPVVRVAQTSAVCWWVSGDDGPVQCDTIDQLIATLNAQVNTATSAAMPV